MGTKARSQTLAGTIHKSDLEGGVWHLRCDDGAIYQLDSTDRGLLVDGQKVEVQGAVATQTMSIGMSAEIFRVTGWTKR